MNFTDIRIISFLFFPILSFLILVFFGKKIKNNSHLIALPLILLTLINSISLLLQSISLKHFYLDNSFEWFNTGSFHVSLGYLVDNITIIML